MAKMMMAAFENISDADKALYELEAFGYSPKQISVISSKKEHSITHGELTDDSDSANGAKDGAVTGGVIGGIAGLLAGVGVIPAMAGLFFAGPIVGALGIAGLVGTTLAGAATGAVAGGLIGALVKAGVPKETAEYYDRVVTEGGVVLGISADSFDSTVQSVLEKYNAKSIQTADMTVREQEEMEQQPRMRSAEPAFGERLDDDI